MYLRILKASFIYSLSPVEKFAPAASSVFARLPRPLQNVAPSIEHLFNNITQSIFSLKPNNSPDTAVYVGKNATRSGITVNKI